MTHPASIGRYTITGELGRGAMGVVYRAMDPALDRPVAIKVIAARTSVVPLSGEELEARFLREARVAARINHPGVVTVHDAGREGNSLYLVMELVEGESLSDRLTRRRFPSAPEALEIVAQAADALGAAHALGVVHRDVKPGNIMLTRGGRVKVADFGVAKAIGEQTDLTRTGTVIGSPAYMAPEQVRGEVLDGRADLFSLGVVLYELLLRRKPFPAETVTTLIYQILHDDPLADPQISRALGEEAAGFLRRCLSKPLDTRVPDAATFAAGARALAARLPVSSIEITGPTMKLPVSPSVATPPAAEAVASAPAALMARSSRFPFGPVMIAVGVGLLALAAVIAVRHLGRRGPVGPGPESTPPVGVAGVAVGPTVAAGGIAPAPRPTFTAHRVIEPPVPPAIPPKAVPELISPPLLEPTVPPVVAIFYCQRGAEFNVSPEETIVTVDGREIGKADDWDGKGDGQTYVFSRPGKHYVRLALPGYRTTWVEIVVDPAANDEIADVDTRLPQT
ncbi:MAG TPA: serine/threonine-protein kinase [Thermoanaerobaculaceae bacterium]|nr:serine/threonine-protein kinase [Thermoanaerobaculaceae bacterium]